MYRSFTNRVFGGVCGGMAAVLPVNAWGVRLAFMILTAATLGGFGVLYLALWLAMPQESLVITVDGGPLAAFVALVLTVAVTGWWLAYLNGLTRLPNGENLYFPLLGLLLSLVFFVKQLGRSA
jgi:phage shock protein PspC (stress-responsive transcriptional regulator)